MKRFFFLKTPFYVDFKGAIIALLVFVLSSIHLNTWSQSRVGDQGVTFDLSKIDARYEQKMLRWKDAGVRGGIPSIASLNILDTLHHGDNSDSLNKAIAAVVKKGGGAILLLNGDYTIDKTVNMQSKVSLIGESKDGVVCSIVKSTGSAFYFGSRVKRSGLYRMTIQGGWGKPKYDWNIGDNVANNELVDNTSISILLWKASDCWVDGVNIFNSGDFPLRNAANATHNTFRDLNVDGVHNKHRGAHGYFFILGKDNLITGCRMTHLRHISIQTSEAEYNVVYDNDFAQEISFHSGDAGNNLIENNQITLPDDMPPKNGGPGYYAIMGPWSKKHHLSLNPNFLYRNQCLELNQPGSPTPWSDSTLVYKGPIRVKTKDPHTNFPQEPTSAAPIGGTFYPVVLSTATKPLLKEGTYYFSSVNNSQRLTNIRSEKSVQMMNPKSWKTQQWIVTHVGNNVYTLQNKGTKKFLEVSQVECSDGASVNTWTAVGNKYQEWKITKIKNQFHLSPSHCLEQALDRKFGTIKLGTNVQTYRANINNPNQHWEITAIDSISARTTKMNQAQVSTEMVAYPNPVANQLNLKNVQVGDEIIIRNQANKVVLRTRLKHRNESLNVKHLKPGIYLLQRGAKIVRLVKQ